MSIGIRLEIKRIDDLALSWFRINVRTNVLVYPGVGNVKLQMLILRGILSLLYLYSFALASAPPEKKSFMSKETKRKFFGDTKRRSNVLVQEDVKSASSKVPDAPKLINFSFLPDK